MKHLKTFGLLAVPLALSACGGLGGGEYGFSSYALVRARRVNVGNGDMSVVAPRPYNRHRRILFEDVRDVEDWTQPPRGVAAGRLRPFSSLASIGFTSLSCGPNCKARRHW